VREMEQQNKKIFFLKVFLCQKSRFIKGVRFFVSLFLKNRFWTPTHFSCLPLDCACTFVIPNIRIKKNTVLIFIVLLIFIKITGSITFYT